MEEPAAGPQRYEAARRAARALAAAVRAARLYSVGHDLTIRLLRSAGQALRAYLDAHGPLDLRVAPRGVAFDFAPQACEDDVVADLGRALDLAGVDGLRFLPDVTDADLEALADALAMPRSALERAGGLGRLLAGRGVRGVSARGPAPSAPAGDPVEDLLRAVRERPDEVPARLVRLGPDPLVAAEMLRRADARVAAWPPAQRDQARGILADALLKLDDPLRAALGRVVADHLADPWAASVAARWPAVVAGSLLADVADLPGRLRALHRGPFGGPLPDAPPPADAEAARAALEAGVGRSRAAARLVDALPHLDAAQVAEALGVVEQVLHDAAAEGDTDAVVRILAALDRVSRRLPDARADQVRQALGRLMSVEVREVLAAGAADLPADHPLRGLLAGAPEAIPVLLELLADEERLAVRRRLVALLAEAARDRLPALAEHLSDPRWYVARNVVTALAWTADPRAVPYLRAALHHGDLRVRAEALAGLASLGTPEARGALQEATRHPDPATREAAGRWLAALGGGGDGRSG
ncbi:MAG: HEAT repeat domain-containing protein [Armatimonadota bacterium]|nr:HEAT repeat domain-containing protein [Armatimonadota bacterium]MDR7436590.1 HEAT repeat domain-containing protein [Armatimonadota bacterium]MDR7472991.1 HEAT repeat domain-containing protein [Armatimonadota bacterium]MDR7506601.1 HEAT repeat domain-containing protein [Armatimonadota bacterium]MDR7509163.1 HEAT repeat domain-containing protein [Armatimonadota bacterium]